MRAFIEAFYRHRNDPDFEIVDNIVRREMGFVAGGVHYRIALSDLVQFEMHVDAANGLPEIEVRIREDHRAFHNDYFEARRQYGVRFLVERGVIRHDESWADVKRRQQESEACARRLLLECLTETQRKTLEEKHYFDVRGPDGELFRIEDAAHSNVYLLDDEEKELARFCGLVYGVPRSDSLLAQKLTLESQPQVFMNVANPVPATIPDYVPPPLPPVDARPEIINDRQREAGMVNWAVEELREEGLRRHHEAMVEMLREAGAN